MVLYARIWDFLESICDTNDCILQSFRETRGRGNIAAVLPAVQHGPDTGGVLQRLRSILSDAGNVTIPPPAYKTFNAEGEALEHALTKSFRIRNEAIKSLCSSVRRFRDATTKEECRSDYPHALQALWKALDPRSGGRSDSELSDVGTDPSREKSPRGSTTSPIP
jgi:hypothetical protein